MFTVVGGIMFGTVCVVSFFTGLRMLYWKGVAENYKALCEQRNEDLRSYDRTVCDNNRTMNEIRLEVGTLRKLEKTSNHVMVSILEAILAEKPDLLQEALRNISTKSFDLHVGVK